ncbi:MAG: hypothetical protein QXS21_02340 [Thermoproteota archaeon]|nr:hypothetical protein [Candidatus Brockarchaeota archaeon]MBO3768425.1 hypothetical protein [Candidatus Brockarchaeota archaeon]MBO3801379.1 hypothetical protein [Candidatus Brockarchaeota archaeon]
MIILLSSLVAFVISLVFVKKVVFQKFIEWGISSKDVHKPYLEQVVPESGGTALLVYEAFFVIFLFLLNKISNEALCLFLVSVIAGFIGLVDDLKNLNKVIKPLLTVVAAFPIFLLKENPSYLLLPFGVRFSIPLVYILLVIIAIPVTSNAINMFDVFNGVATGTTLIAVLGLTVLKFINIVTGRDSFSLITFSQVTFLLIPGILLLYFFNRYPSKMFVGDTGTLSMGAIVGALSIIYRLELAGVLFLLLPITNSFVSLSIFGGLFERSELKERPIIVEKDGTLKPNESKSAPVTLTRIVLLFGYKKEKEVIHFYMVINLILFFFGIISYLLVM